MEEFSKYKSNDGQTLFPHLLKHIEYQHNIRGGGNKDLLGSQSNSNLGNYLDTPTSNVQHYLEYSEYIKHMFPNVHPYFPQHTLIWFNLDLNCP